MCEEIDSEGAGEGGGGGGEDLAAVVDGDVVGFYGGVEGLEVAVEEEGVEGAGGGGLLADG